MGFSGFGDRATVFYEGLEADNSKAYWSDHKDVFEEHVRAPMQALMEQLDIGDVRVWRPYRDLRFSKDKTPYKTHCGAAAGGLYVQVDADGLLVARGYYSLQSDQVERLRVAIDDERRGGELVALLARLTTAGYEVRGETLTRVPRGYDAGHPRIDLLKHKSLYVARRFEPDDVLHEPACVERVRDAHRAMLPVTRWLDDHVGPSATPQRRR